MTAKAAPVAVTMGEPGGIGAETTIKAWGALNSTGPAFLLIDDPARIESMGARVARITSPAEAGAAFQRALPVLDLDETVEARPGVADPVNAPSVIASIDRAVALALKGEAIGVATNPIQKAALAAAGFRFPGHTEYLGALTEKAAMPAGRRRGPVMMIASRTLKTVPLTIHAPVKDVAALLTEDLIVETAMIVIEALAQDFGLPRPRLAIAGLNPHAGEDGALGREEIKVIAPAVGRLRAIAQADIAGPLSADTMFHEAARARFDAALCMYHDQALIPVKTLAFAEAVNLTLGLPIIRTSPDHGTALDIAGKGLADPSSLIAAIRLADEMGRRRRGA
jgi:4-hydroxythreonine-4-phosphate dehydrogenase